MNAVSSAFNNSKKYGLFGPFCKIFWQATWIDKYTGLVKFWIFIPSDLTASTYLSTVS